MDSDVQARSLHKDFTFTWVVWLVCSRSSGVTGKLRSFSGHKDCLCVGKFTLGIRSVATKVTMLILLCFSCKEQEQPAQGFSLALCLQPNLLLTSSGRASSTLSPVLFSMSVTHAVCSSCSSQALFKIMWSKQRSSRIAGMTAEFTFPCCPFLQGGVGCCSGMDHPKARDWTSSHPGSLPVKAGSVFTISLSPGFSGWEHKSPKCRFLVWEPSDE